MSFDVAAYLTDGLNAVNWLPVDLWIAVIGLTGRLKLGEVSDILSGERQPSEREYDLLALAINERFLDLGGDHPMNYWAELPRV